jgi:hypothetical protein
MPSVAYIHESEVKTGKAALLWLSLTFSCARISGLRTQWTSGKCSPAANVLVTLLAIKNENADFLYRLQ